MSNKNENINIDDIIQTLMRESSWGQHADLKFLVKNLGNEYYELLDGIRREDKENSFEEAADVLMMMLCILNKLAPDEEDYIGRLIELITTKLRSRYEPIYTRISDSNSDIGVDEENRIWESAKSEEKRSALLFCPNKKCNYYGDILRSNISKDGDLLMCNYCGHIFPLKNDSILLGEARSQRKYYLSIIERYLQLFCHGDINATNDLFEREKRSFRMFSKYILNSDEKTYIFVQYMIKKYTFNEDDVVRFISEIKTMFHNNVFIQKSLVDELTIFADSLMQPNEAMSYHTPQEIKKLKSAVDQIRFQILQKVEKVIRFEARGWDKQVATKYLFSYDDMRIIECMAIVHFHGNTIRDFTIELSNMYGCPVGCGFCASGALTEEPLCLTALDFLKQLSTCLFDTGYVPADFERFYVSFAGIGEPSLVYSEILKGMRVIKTLYPHVQFNIATIGIVNECFSVWKESVDSIRTIQIPLYATEYTKIKKIVRSIPTNYELKSVIRASLDYKAAHPQCRIKLNYIVICGYNDSDDDVMGFISYLAEFKNDIVIKIAYLNETIPSRDRGLVSPSSFRMKQIEKMLNDSGCTSYVFGTEQNSELGCGQLIQGIMRGGKNEV